MGNDVWHIDKAGLYLFGHANVCCLMVHISRPGKGWAFGIPLEQVCELFDILDIDYEDGVFVHERLTGRYVTVIGDQGSFAGSVVRKVGDPYGEKIMELREEE